MPNTLYATRWHQNTEHELLLALEEMRRATIPCLGFTSKIKLESNFDYLQVKRSF